MCGFSGLLSRSNAPIDAAILRAMNERIAHRGPDGAGYHTTRHVGLGHRRLAVIDLATGRQPLFDESGEIAVVFNGEIYNFQALRAELEEKGFRFRTRSDTEILVHGWRAWGSAMVERLQGMFAFALWDEAQQCLFLARDRLGKKPLYYAELEDGELVFGSEIGAVLAHPRVQRRLDPAAVDEYLAYGYVPDPRSIYASIRKLPPAHLAVVTRGTNTRLRPREYWRPNFSTRVTSEADAVAELDARLHEATRARLVADVPVGAFLSGGVDSSAVVAHMATAQSEKVRSFAIGFGRADDEFPFARLVADRYRTVHREALAPIDHVGTIGRIARIYGEPFADPSAVATLQVCTIARQDVTVALSGDGGDEVFAGYRRHRLFAQLQRIASHLPQPLRHAAGRLGKAWPAMAWAPRPLRAKRTLLELGSDPFEAYYRTVCRMHDDVRLGLRGPLLRSLDEDAPSQVIRRHMAEASADTLLDRALYADLRTWLPGAMLTKVDRASMAVGLEVRSPLLDHTLVEWAAGLDDSLRLGPDGQKYVLRQSLRARVPAECLDRSKRGFTAPLADLLRSDGAAPVIAQLARGRAVSEGLVDGDAVARLLQAHARRRADHAQPIWSLLMLDAFLSEVHAEPLPAIAAANTDSWPADVASQP